MVIRLVAHGDLLLADLLEQFTVRSVAARRAGRNGVALKDPAHVVEQSGGRQEHIGLVGIVEVVHKELCILVSLFCRFTEIRPGPLTILLDILSGEVQLPQSILCVLVSPVRRNQSGTLLL